MRLLFTTLALSLALLPIQSYALTNADVAEVTEKLESLSADELVNRKTELENSLEEGGLNEEEEERALLELSIIEQLLILVGVVIAGNVSDETKTPPDSIFPVITILGDNPATVELGSSYSDAGATSDGGETVTSSGTVDTNTVGTYTITYSATDAAGNTSTATRTVNVVDTTAPVITLLGGNPVTTELGATYNDAGATADDASGSVAVVTSGTVDTSTLGSYTLTYSATDASGNTATVTRVVNVVDTTAPVITLLGGNPVTLELGEAYDEQLINTPAGATATDASGAVTVSAVTNVDSLTVGTYSVIYTSTDASGNTATVTRVVNVVDTTAPIITSSDTFVADENQTAIGTVTATDLQTVTFTVSGSELQITSGGVLTFVTAPDYETKSVYTATVTATDASSNSSTQDITVNVNDVGGIDDDPGTGTGTGTGTVIPTA